MDGEDSAFKLFEKHMKANASYISPQPDDIIVAKKEDSVVLPQLKLDLPSPPWFKDSIYSRNGIWSRDFPSQSPRLNVIGPLQSGISLSCNELCHLEGGSVNTVQSLHSRPIKTETEMPPNVQVQCGARSCSMLPPIHFLHSLLRHADAPTAVPALPEHKETFSSWNMPPNDARFFSIAGKRPLDQPSSRPPPPAQTGPPPSPAAVTAVDKNSSWRRTPKRWGLAEWERDDSGARERRREQNREAQRRFREKRHRAAAAATPPSPSPPE
jgi:hypothetical protein